MLVRGRNGYKNESLVAATIELRRAIVEGQEINTCHRSVVRSVGAMSTALNDEVHNSDMATARIVDEGTSQPLGTVQRSEVSNAGRVMLYGVEYDAVGNFGMGQN